MRSTDSSSTRETKAGIGNAHTRADRRIGADRRDRLKQLRGFCHTARLGTITKAAEHVFSSQPAVSLQLRALEAELSVALFEHSGPRIALTAAGRALYRRALPLVEGIDRLPDTFNEQHRQLAGSLHIGAGEAAASYLLPSLLEALAEHHDEIEVHVRVGSAAECLFWLRSYDVDVVVGAMDTEAPDLDFNLLVCSPYTLITPRGHPLSHLDLVRPRDLGEQPQIAHTPQNHIRQLGEMYLRQHGVTPNVVVSVDGWEAIKEHVEAGLGVAVVPALCLTRQDRVRRVPFEDTLSPRRYGHITRRESVVPLAVRRFIAVADAARVSDSSGPA